MDDRTLAEIQRRMSTQVCTEIIRQSREFEQMMETKFQKLWENAHKQLVFFLQTLDQDYSEACEKGKRPLESFSDDDLAYLIHIRLQKLICQDMQSEPPGERNMLIDQLKESSKKNQDLEAKYSDLIIANKKIQAENTALSSQLSAFQAKQKKNNGKEEPKSKRVVNRSSLNSNSTPDWLHAWRESKIFEMSSTAILVMGQTGKALRASITRGMAQQLALPVEGESLEKALNWLLTDAGDLHPCLIEELGATPVLVSNSVLRLSKAGEITFRALTGQAPKENEYDRLIRLHSAPEQSILNIQSAEILTQAGYTIQGQAQKVQLPEGGTIIPDSLVVDSSTGERILLKVEWEGPKDLVSRKQKWINLHRASKGNLYVFCDNITSQRAVQSEMNLALAGLVYQSNLTNLLDLEKGKLSEKNGIWLSSKQNLQY